MLHFKIKVKFIYIAQIYFYHDNPLSVVMTRSLSMLASI